MPKPSLSQRDFHRDCVGFKIAETFQVPSYHLNLPQHTTETTHRHMTDSGNWKGKTHQPFF